MGTWFTPIETHRPLTATLPMAIREAVDEGPATVLRAMEFAPIASAQADDQPPSPATSARDLHRLEAIGARIHDLQRQVVKLRLRYTEAYPDVVAARRQIRGLKSERQRILARVERNAVADEGYGATGKFTPDGPSPLPRRRSLGRLPTFPAPGVAVRPAFTKTRWDTYAQQTIRPPSR
jgi:hypothetical protein